MSWRQPVARGALLVMETLWVYALVVLIASLPTDRELPSLLGIGLIVFLPYGISRLLQLSDLELGVIRIWGVIASVLLFYAIVRVDFFGDWRFWDFGWADRFAGGIGDAVEGNRSAVLAIPVLWFFWMRGVSRGQDPLMFEAVVSSFATGVVIIAVVELLATALDAPPAIGYVAVPYIALGLLAIGLTHAARSELEYGRSFSWTWLLSIGGAVLVLSLVAVIFVFIDLSTMADAIIFVGRMIGLLLFGIFYVITYAIAYVMQFLVEGLLAVFRWLSGNTDPVQPEDQGPPPEVTDKASDHDLPEWAQVFGRVTGGLGVLALAIAALYLTFARFQKRQTPGVMKESTYHEGRLGADLGGFLGAMLGRLRPNFHLGGESDPARRLYYDMLDEASHRGIVRGPSQTPLELAPSLDITFGPPAPTRITILFDDSVYGAIRHSDADVRPLRDEWDAARRDRQG